MVATGSPFDPVRYKGRKHVIGQCNNAFVFPGVGLGVLISEASRVTDSMFLAAARALAEFTVTHAASDNCLYPSLSELRTASRLIAFKVAQTARDEGFGQSLDDKALQAAIEDFCWFPDYPATESAPPAPKARPRRRWMPEAVLTRVSSNSVSPADLMISAATQTIFSAPRIFMNSAHLSRAPARLKPRQW